MLISRRGKRSRAITDTDQGSQTCQTTPTEHIGGIRVELSFLKQDKHTVKERAAVAEQHISYLEDTVHPLEGSVQNVQKEVAVHDDKLGDMEDCLRHNNMAFWRE